MEEWDVITPADLVKPPIVSHVRNNAQQTGNFLMQKVSILRICFLLLRLFSPSSPSPFSSFSSSRPFLVLLPFHCFPSLLLLIIALRIINIVDRSCTFLLVAYSFPPD